MIKNLRYLAEEHNKKYFFYFDRPNIDFEENLAAYSSNRTALCWEYGEQTILP